jgi:hypothetical protein
MRDSNLLNDFSESTIGAIFTPLQWAEFAIEQFGLFDKWMAGNSIFDPTMGEGNLVEALIALGIKKGFRTTELPIENLYGVEINSRFFDKFFEKIHDRYGLELSRENFVNADIFFLKVEKQFDTIFGNPPWQNFVDLPSDYKGIIKQAFFKYDLIGNAQDLLLGGSRIDIAALVIQKTIEKNLKPKGEAIFFMPLSLFLNDGANKHFRTYKVHETNYWVDKIFDFNDADVFEGIATRYGLVHFVRNEKQQFPIKFCRWEKGVWKDYFAKPVFHETDPLSIVENIDDDFKEVFVPINIKKESAPRQGLNTCGANNVFFFHAYREIDEDYCFVENTEKAVLPKKYVFPLITGKNFKQEYILPDKWVFVPHNLNGKPIEWQQIQQEETLTSFLLPYKNQLSGRKGTLINVWIQKGYWWALLGVGEYNFFPFKIVWEAYGKTAFKPKIFPGTWQANQSLQAFIPLKSKDEANDVLHLLKNKKIEDYLRSLKMEGTMNWAQPGKIKKLIQYKEEVLTLF